MAPSQLRLCERLLLLRLCTQPGDLNAKGGSWDFIQGPSGAIKNDTRSELTILNAICLILQTDEEGDRVAAALDRNYGPPHLILARSIPVTQAHIDTTRELFSILRNPQLEKLIRNVFPIIHRNHLLSLRRKIKSINEALIAFYTGPESYPADLQGYEPLPKVQEEFPVACTLIDEFYPNEKPDTKGIVIRLLEHLTEHSSFDITEMTEEKALHNFLEILNVARLLRFARLFQSWATIVTDTCLRKALDEILQYANLLHVLNAIKRWYRDSDTTFRWIHIPEEDRYHQAKLDLPHDPISIISHTLSVPPTTEPCSTLYDEYPDLREKWATYPNIHTRLHPEMQLILDLSDCAAQTASLNRNPQRAIGMSGESCVCCVHWINVFNLTSNMRWTLSNSENPAPLDETWRGAGKKLLEVVMGPSTGFTPDRQVFDFVRSLMHQKFAKVKDWDTPSDWGGDLGGWE